MKTTHSKTNNQACIISIPLVFYEEVLYLGIVNTLNGKVRRETLYRANAGKQVMLAIEQATLKAKERLTDLIVFIDDRFNSEKGNKPDHQLMKDFRTNIREKLPEILRTSNVFFESEFDNTNFCGLDGCRGVWGNTLEHLNSLGYTYIEAWIPEPCMNHVHVATGLMTKMCPDVVVVIHHTHFQKRSVVKSYRYEKGVPTDISV